MNVKAYPNSFYRISCPHKSVFNINLPKVNSLEESKGRYHYYWSNFIRYASYKEN